MSAVHDSAFTPLVVPRVGQSSVDARSISDKARARGYAAGYAEGRRIALEQAQARQAADQDRMRAIEASSVAQRADALDALRVAQARLSDQIAQVSDLDGARVEELAIQLATVILGVELSEPARSAAHALRRALAELPASRWRRVTFSPQDFEILAADEDASNTLHGVEILASEEVDPGGALVEIDHGSVDTRIVEALGRAAAAHDGGVHRAEARR